jgi:hypothetical protein
MRERFSSEIMKSIYFLLSSSEGIPISKCCSSSSQSEPNWQNIARLIAFIANIFPDQEESQFNDGKLTYYSYPQPMQKGSYYFVTFFTDDGAINLSSLSKYVGIVSSILFQSVLEECFKYLESRMSNLISNSTYQHTLENDAEDENFNDADPQHQLYEFSPHLMDTLQVFEEHFIHTVLVSGEKLFVPWFRSITNYSDCEPFSSLVVLLSNDEPVLSLISASLNFDGDPEIMSKELQSALITYTRVMNPFVDSHVLYIKSSHSGPAVSNDKELGKDGNFVAVSQFYQVS